jgi:hypothetical protein
MTEKIKSISGTSWYVQKSISVLSSSDIGQLQVEEVPGYLNCMFLLLLELVLESNLEAVLLLKFEP